VEVLTEIAQQIGEHVAVGKTPAPIDEFETVVVATTDDRL
jgi:hypothetical protein